MSLTVADIAKATMVPPGFLRNTAVDWPRDFWRERPIPTLATWRYPHPDRPRDGPYASFWRWLDSAKPMLTFRERWAYTAGPETLEG